MKTNRLTLRRFAIDDAVMMYHNWATDDKTVKYMSWEVHTSTEATQALLLQWVAEYGKPDYYNWVIEYEGDIIGSINLHDISEDARRCELGYSIGSRWWNLGIVTEAARVVTEYAFAELNANKVCAMHDVENIGSGRVMQKIGMKLEGVIRQHSMRRDGSLADMARYGVLREEWMG